MLFCFLTIPASPPEADSAALDLCLSRISAGDQSALAELYDRTRSAIYGFALSLLKNVHDAEDVLQEVYLQVWQAAGRYRSGCLQSPAIWP